LFYGRNVFTPCLYTIADEHVNKYYINNQIYKLTKYNIKRNTGLDAAKMETRGLQLRQLRKIRKWKDNTKVNLSDILKIKYGCEIKIGHWF